MSEEKPTVTSSEPLVSAKELEKERAHTQHYEQLYKDTSAKYKGIDPDQYRKDQEELSALRRKATGGDETKIQELIAAEKAELEKRYAAKLQELETELGTTKSEFKREKVTKTIVAGLTGKARADSVALLEPVIERDCAWEDGKLIIKDSSGKPRYSKTNPSNLMSPDEYIAELQGTFPSCFEATSKSGGKSGIERVSGHATQITSMEDFKRLPGGGKDEMKKLANDNPAAFKALMRGEQSPTK